MEIEASGLGREAGYKLMTGVVVPRPIAWVTSGAGEGPVNLAPFSAFTFVSTHPPMLGFNVGLRNGERKDTARNIRATGEFVVHIADDTMAQVLHASARDYAPDESEADALGLETLACRMVSVRRLKDAPIAMECRLDRILQFGMSGAEFFVGNVLLFHVRDDLYADGKIETRKLRPLCRIAGPNYAGLGDIMSM